MRIMLVVLLSLWVGTLSMWGLRLPEGTEARVSEVRKDSEGRIRQVMLAEPTRLNTPLGRLVFAGPGRLGIRFDIGWIEFHENGTIKSGTFAEPQIVRTPIGQLELSDIWFHESGRIEGGEFAEARVVDTPVGKLELSQIWFHESDKISGGEFAKVQAVNTPTGRLGLRDIWFHENGRIRAGHLSKEETIRRVVFVTGTLIGWDENRRFLGEMEQDEVWDDFVPVDERN